MADEPAFDFTSLRGDVLPRALAAFVKRPQAALLKSALELFYKYSIRPGQTNVIIFFSPLSANSFQIIRLMAADCHHGHFEQTNMTSQVASAIRKTQWLHLPSKP
jgi:hypothetical protein